jgi:hypothetical protein
MAMPGLVAVSRSIDVTALGSMAATRADGVGGALGWGRRGPVAALRPRAVAPAAASVPTCNKGSEV